MEIEKEKKKTRTETYNYYNKLKQTGDRPSRPIQFNSNP
jgi:hypothetical protein